MDLQLAGRTALVTGASAGIGIGIAECLAREGVRMALAGRNKAALADVAQRVTALGAPPPVMLAADLATVDGCARVAAEALAGLGGRVDIVVNNAGGSRPLAGEETEEFWDEAFALNFSSARRVTKPLVPAMKANGFGRVINISGALFAPAVNGATPAKVALVSWSRALSFELMPHGITVNCVGPGRINSVQILEKLHPTEESRSYFIRQNIPAGRFGEPQELGHLVAFLASPLAGYISGVNIPVDGGAVRLGT